jgi:hypothetical protein
MIISIIISIISFTLSGELLHELSNDGAKNQFQEFLEQFIVPVMVDAAKVKQI